MSDNVATACPNPQLCHSVRAWSWWDTVDEVLRWSWACDLSAGERYPSMLAAMTAAVEAHDGSGSDDA
jgi:hypothetical protein